MTALKILIVLTAMQAIAGVYKENSGHVWRSAIAHGLAWWAYCTTVSV